MKTTVDSRQLKAIAALARTASFTLAAKELRITQSAVSHAIKALEDDLGCRLFDRVGKRVQLTVCGEQFLRHAHNILREMQAARAGVEEVLQRSQSFVRVGASTTACQHILPTVLREFRERYPNCLVRIETGDQGRQLELLKAGRIDFAFLIQTHPQASRDLVFVPLFEDELRLFVAPQHPWAELQAVPAGALEAETLILYNKSSYTFQLIADYFKEEKVALTNYIELGSIEAIKELVKLGLGAGVLAPWIASAELANGTLVSLPLGRRRLRRQWSVAYWKGRRLAKAESIFVGLCETVARSIGLAELELAG